MILTSILKRAFHYSCLIWSWRHEEVLVHGGKNNRKWSTIVKTFFYCYPLIYVFTHPLLWRMNRMSNAVVFKHVASHKPCPYQFMCLWISAKASRVPWATVSKPMGRCIQKTQKLYMSAEGLHKDFHLYNGASPFLPACMPPKLALEWSSGTP